MDLETLRLFVDLAQTKSFSKTADRNYMSQSAVSQRMRALEQEFGQTLIERGKGRPGAQFTEAGAHCIHTHVLSPEGACYKTCEQREQ